MNSELMDKIINDDWFKTRPDSIKELILKYPPDTIFKINDKRYFVIAYSEGADGKAVGLILTEHDPSTERGYNLARKENFYTCLDCIERSVISCGH